MNKEILIYAIPKNETERYMEDLISSRCKSQKDVDAVIAAATKDGWHSFRVAGFTYGEMPNFAGAVAA